MDGEGAVRDAGAVVRDYLEALRTGDLAGVVATLADDVVMLTTDGSLMGRDAFRAGCEQMFAGFLAPGTYERRVEDLTVEGDLVLMVWSATCLGSRIPLGVTTFVVRDGLIARVTAAYRLEPD